MKKYMIFNSPRLIFMAVLCLLQYAAQAQLENLWVMGRRDAPRATLDFNGGGVPTSAPIVQTPAPNQIPWGLSGNASVCDEQGQLLFFSDGTSAWDRNGNLMPNGTEITGEPGNFNPWVGGIVSKTSDWQGNLIVPMPDTTNVYYLFSLTHNYYNPYGGTAWDDFTKENCRLYYSIIDMSLNSGMGDVVAGRKGILIDTGFNSKLTAIAGNHCNAWVILTTPYGKFKVYEVNEAGINTVPVTYNTNFADSIAVYGGVIIPSPDRSHLAVSRLDFSQAFPAAPVALFDFDPETGIISNEMPILHYGFDLQAPVLAQGMAFSPDNNKLYVAIPLFGVYQYDLSSNNGILIALTQTMVNGNTGILAFKLGPDGKIYGWDASTLGYPPSGSECIDVIQSPNLDGIACNYNSCFLTIANNSNFPNVVPKINGHADTSIVIDSCFVTNTAGIALKATDGMGWDYVWNTGAAGPNLFADTPGAYWVNYVTAPCIRHSDTFLVHFSKLPTLHAKPTCHGQSNGMAWVEPFAGDIITYVYEWRNESGQLLQGPDYSDNGSTLSGQDSGTYFVSISSFGCDTIMEITIGDIPSPEITATPSHATIRYGDSISLHVTGAQSYHWQPAGYILGANNSADPLAKPLESTVFTVLGINENGCIDTALVHINIDFSMPVMIPNAFSPNGDGLNDVFSIIMSQYHKTLDFSIFNRWGERVFTTYDGTKGWDGTINGKPADVGVYFYRIQLQLFDGTTKTWKGDVTLIR